MSRIDVAGVGEYIRDQREQAKLSLRQLASRAGISNPYLSQIERGSRTPSAQILAQIAKGLQISAESLYVRAGILDEVGATLTFDRALAADPLLNNRQRQVLREIYGAFVKENAGTPGAIRESTDLPDGSEVAELGRTNSRPTETGTEFHVGSEMSQPSQAARA